MTADDVLLVHAGSGSVGQAAVQFAVAWGATVIATASPARHDQLRELGAIPVAYGDGLLDRVRAAAPSPLTVVLDCAGTDEAIETSLALVADRDRIATIVRGPDAADFGIRAFSGGSPSRSRRRSWSGAPRRCRRPWTSWPRATSPSSSARSCPSPSGTGP
ncbi:zinc-binding dehydrogenase [Microbacterium sp. NRRL B-14842]|uniref:zinc-binding dehydrogenase n=1 Tax=Microbacterium sp. NRRL B-14842 TaxID=3162881 RepID=UPI003D29DD5D